MFIVGLIAGLLLLLNGNWILAILAIIIFFSLSDG